MSRKTADTSGRKSGPSLAIARSPYGAVLRPLEGQVLCLSKNLDIADHTRHNARELAQELGATVESQWTDDVTHVVVPRAEYWSWSAKLTNANKGGIPVVRAPWLVECDRSQKFVAIDTHVWETVLAEEEKLKAARESYQSAQRKQDRAESNDQSSRPGRPKVDDADDRSLGEKLKKHDAVLCVTDEFFKDRRFTVYFDENSKDATLNKTNAEDNSNEYYLVQLLNNSVAHVFCVWTRWGRVGEVGRTRKYGDGTLENAMYHFRRKLNYKLRLGWEIRPSDPIPGYGDGPRDEDADNLQTKDVVKRVCGVEPECTLETPVRDLMELIFNEANMKTAMAQLKYNANKHPLSEIAWDTIKRGYERLKALSAVLDDKTFARRKYDISRREAIDRLSKEYYSLIRHDFGEEKPPNIDKKVILQHEIQLLESLSGMKFAEELMKASQIRRGHHLDHKFQSLHLKEMTPLLREAKEFKLLEQYLYGTFRSAHSYRYNVVDIFRIEREGERKRFQGFAPAKSFRRLLWHGSRSTNYAAILSQGLRIPPPEAPASGYMFGKGIYLADMSSKSAEYCFPNISNGEGLLLLCETELGDCTAATEGSGTVQRAKENGCDSAADVGRVCPGDWVDGKEIHKNLRGVDVPDPSARPKSGGYRRDLQLTEYVCCDASQVLLRYLFRVKMT